MRSFKIGGWKELVPYMLNLAKNPAPAHRESALLVFAALGNFLSKAGDEHIPVLQSLYQAGLSDPEVKVCLQSAVSLFVCFCWMRDDDTNSFPV